MEKIKAQTMDNKINIAEILKDCPEGMKLYSPLFGEVKFKGTSEYGVSILSTKIVGGDYLYSFTKNGIYYPGYSQSECLLVPSSKMRDWTKFFKRGDVVYGKNDMYAIFEGWANDDYTKFNTTIGFYVFDASFDMVEVCDTDDFVKVSDEERVAFIADMEKHFGGKYNPETLQVEPVKVERPFKPFGEKIKIKLEEIKELIEEYENEVQ